ncbi:RHS repeat-associated core domain-containing protein [bacterium]|nr:RHS repeat-associated core domain-containing protein [bacterium]
MVAETCVPKKVHIGKIFALPNGDYYPFGKESRSSSSSNKPREQFTGKERDAESGLDYFGARYYNSEIGRWVSVDPALSTRPQDFLMEHGLYSLSAYQYVRGNPINRFDPDGATDWWAVTKSAVKVGLSVGAIEGGVIAMAASTVSEVGSAGTLTPLAWAGFAGGLGLFTGGVVGVGENIKNFKLAWDTPDGMKAEDFSIVRDAVKGLGGNKITAETVKTVVDAIGLKDASSLGEEGLTHLVGVLDAAGATSDGVVKIMELLKGQTKKGNQEKDKEEQSKSGKEEER